MAGLFGHSDETYYIDGKEIGGQILSMEWQDDSWNYYGTGVGGLYADRNKVSGPSRSTITIKVSGRLSVKKNPFKWPVPSGGKDWVDYDA